MGKGVCVCVVSAKPCRAWAPDRRSATHVGFAGVDGLLLSALVLCRVSVVWFARVDVSSRLSSRGHVGAWPNMNTVPARAHLDLHAAGLQKAEVRRRAPLGAPREQGRDGLAPVEARLEHDAHGRVPRPRLHDVGVAVSELLPVSAGVVDVRRLRERASRAPSSPRRVWPSPKWSRHVCEV